MILFIISIIIIIIIILILFLLFYLFLTDTFLNHFMNTVVIFGNVFNIFQS